ncbi:peptidase C14 [Paenibacillus sp. LMG 31460]|uniref:Peptidase C14 n=1 Tax=Paenibacillus germinis TaxID=2654979 RepID=A0ABX1Z2W1_9BACL|nr:peptidase C14 [Paenibacillus germinis]NOU87733.1 peptidase C14 [Paenibacillus germinis]
MFFLNDKKEKSNATNVSNEENLTNDKANETISRRKVLATIGLGGAMLAGSALAPRFASADNAQSNSNGDTQVLRVNNVEELKSLPSGQLTDGLYVFVGGYNNNGDGGGKLVRFVEGSTKADNGGTVHRPTKGSRGREQNDDDKGHKPPKGEGCFEVIHNGVGDFRWFGIFDGSKNADDALDALINDLSIHRVEAHSDLNFVKRHVFHRSDIEVDFHGHTVTTVGIELNTLDNPFGAVLFFQGVITGVTQIVTLTEDLSEYSDIFEVADSSIFEVDSWWHTQIKNNPSGGAQRELDYLIKVTEILDATHVRFNYKLGWQLAKGRPITYKKINPAFRCNVRNMSFIGIPVPPNGTSLRPFPTWDQIGSNPVAYEFAVECDASGIKATKVFWPVVMRRYNTHFVTERCQLMNPEERDWGGTGYLTQQINVLYGHVRDCNTSNARHLNDFTCAAYCMVENCHGDGDEYGPFVTHGQFEHDLTYINNSGLLSFANSGTTWGDSAKRVTVKKHIASRIVAHKRLTDLTLEDCHAVVTYTKPGVKMANSGSFWVNMDGLQMRGCTAQEMVTISKSSSRGKRKNIIDSCSFGMLKGYEIARPIRSGTTQVGFTPSNGELTILNSEFYNVEDVTLGSINKLTLINTWFKGLPQVGGTVKVGTREIIMQGGGLVDCCFLFTGAWDKVGDVNNAKNKPDQWVTIDGGAVFSGVNGEKAFLKSVDPSNVVTWNFGNYTSIAADVNTGHFHIQGGTNKLKAIGSHFTSGKYEVADGAFGNSTYFFMTSCVEEGVNRAALPTENETVKHSVGNFSII